MTRKTVGLFLISCAAACLAASGAAWGAPAKGPVKVFILAGQSNMEGQGAIGGSQKGTLETLVKDPASAPRYKHLVDQGGKWVVRDDVWCSYGNKGKLTVGGFAGEGSIGPELGIGWVLGDYLDNQVLLLKIAVGGTSLAQNWRPPSSGGEVGWLYKTVLDAVRKLPETLKADFPDYDGKGFEVAGFCWHQGWNDGCVAAQALEYETNMVNFIKDIRKDLGAPKLPFVIGGSGFGGWGQKNARRLKIMEAQQAAAGRDEFKGNVMCVETRPFFRPREESPNGFGYHWNCNAETYYLIGEGMGKAMVELLGGPKAPTNAVNPNPKKERKTSAPRAPIEAVKLPDLTLDLGGSVTMKLVRIPAGKFVMGSPDGEEGRSGNEGPQREVILSKPFYIGAYELTVAQYEQFVKETGYEYKRLAAATRGDHPLTGPNWDDAQAFCTWMAKKTGRRVRLPTEAEWEYACRAGTTTRFYFGDDDEDLAEFGHYDMDGWNGSACNSSLLAPVGTFKPNAWGLYDTCGNVGEGCQDYISGAYSPDDRVDPKGSTNVARRVSRGGNWHSSPEGCRSACRGNGIRQGLGGPREGFRIVVEAD